MAAAMKEMKIVHDVGPEPESAYIVPWLESEGGWGQRSEGYKIYLDLEFCKKDTKEASAKGYMPSCDTYYGPARPLRYFEIPLDAIPAGLRMMLAANGKAHSVGDWEPKYKSKAFSM